MTAMDPRLRDEARGGRDAGAALDLAVFDDPAAIGELWHGFEAVAVGSPYQRRDWVEAYWATLGRAQGLQARIVVGREADGSVALVLPLALRRAGPARVAVPIGGRQANVHGALWRSGLRLGEPRAFLRRVGRLVGADVVSLPFGVRSWAGEANPLVPADAAASGDRVATLILDATGEATLARSVSRDTRKKLRQKENRLREAGTLAFAQAVSPGEVEAVLGAFFAQKAERRRAIGLPNPFEAPAARDFLRRACLAGLERGTPAVELYALRLGERVIATFAGAADGSRFSGMVNAFDAADADLARRSPGDLLILHLVADQCRRGRRMFDLGVGDARYKETFCDGVEELVALTIPVTPLGSAYAGLATALAAARRRAKATPAAVALLRRLRRLRVR